MVIQAKVAKFGVTFLACLLLQSCLGVRHKEPAAEGKQLIIVWGWIALGDVML